MHSFTLLWLVTLNYFDSNGLICYFYITLACDILITLMGQCIQTVLCASLILLWLMMLYFRLSSGPYFSYFSLLFLFAPTIHYFFMKIPYYPNFFTLKCHLHIKIQIFSSLARIFKLTTIFFPRVRLLKNTFFKF